MSAQTFSKVFNKNLKKHFLIPFKSQPTKYWVHPVLYTQTDCHAGPVVNPDPRVSRSRDRAAVDRPALADGEVPGKTEGTNVFLMTNRVG